MSQAGVIDFVSVAERPARLRIAALLDWALFGSLLALICFAAIPYGTSQPWWKALFICFVLTVTILAVIQTLLSDTTHVYGIRLVLPIFVLAGFAFLQTVSLPSSQSIPGLSAPAWQAISADPYQTRFVALQLIALALSMLLFYRYVNTERRMLVLIHVVLGVAVASAIYGILRQTIQRETGFVLPLLKPGSGYGQFINKNHFAFLMEMGLGLGLGLIANGKRQHRMVYVAVLLPIWTSIVLSNSRGGILAMMVQLVFAALLISYLKRSSPEHQGWLVGVTQSKTMRAVLIVVLIVGLGLSVVWIGGDRLLSNFEGVSREFSRDEVANSQGVTRNDIWRATLRTFAAHPIVGVGFGGYWIAITRYHEASGTMTPQEAHSDYLELLASGGIVGFAIGVWFVVTVFRVARANLQTTSRMRTAIPLGAVLGISGAALHSMFDFGLHLMANALVFAALLTLATANIESRNKAVKNALT